MKTSACCLGHSCVIKATQPRWISAHLFSRNLQLERDGVGPSAVVRTDQPQSRSLATTETKALLFGGTDWRQTNSSAVQHFQTFMVIYLLSVHRAHITGDRDSIADTVLIHGPGCLSVTREHQLILTNHLKTLTYLHSIKLSEVYSQLTAGSPNRSMGR